MTKQRGFTLIELVVSASLVALVATGGASAIYYMIKVNSQVNEKLPALNTIQIAGRWLSRDAEMARLTNLVDGAGPVEVGSTTVEFYRTDYYADPPTSHITRYTRIGAELQRDEDGQTTIVARDVTGATFSISGRLVTMVVSSAGQDRTYQARLRSE